MKIGFLECQFCGVEFNPVNSKQKYCSQSCNQKSWYYRNPDKVISKRNKQSNDYVKFLLQKVKSRAASSGIPFDLEDCDIHIPDECPILGIPIYRNVGHKGGKNNSPSLDRIIPENGYTKGNVRIISNRANLLKSNASVRELELVLKDLKAIHD